MNELSTLRQAVRTAELTRRLGVVRELRGLAIASEGPACRVGELCAILAPGQELPANCGPWACSQGGVRGSKEPILAEVVGLQPGLVTLMPYGPAKGLRIGSTVVALGEASGIGVGDGLIGRVIDGFGRAMDGQPDPLLAESRPLVGRAINPMERPRIGRVLETGIRSIDVLLTLGQGQRIGIFSGSGVGKSTLLGMIARHVRADVNVIALIGERGREGRDFIEKQLGQEGMQRSVVVVATADQPALARIRAAHAAVTIAEHFRERGRQVVITMDSITRLAMARREVGLSSGEPPTARGYTPSVFAELPELCERFGTAPSGGSITALLTVLVEGDDLNEPVSDALRAILDGHVVLSRHLAHQGQYPAIDLLKSASRLLPDLASPRELELVTQAIRVISLLDRNRQMVELGAYQTGSNPTLDAALRCQPHLAAWLRQSGGGMKRAEAVAQLERALNPPPEAKAQPAGRTQAPKAERTKVVAPARKEAR